MQRTQVYLSDEQEKQLKLLAHRTGRRQSELIRDAIDLLLRQQASTDWKDAFRDACGLWAGRTDIEAVIAEARESVDRRLGGR